MRKQQNCIYLKICSAILIFHGFRLGNYKCAEVLENESTIQQSTVLERGFKRHGEEYGR